MTETLYNQIAASIRTEIYNGTLRPGDELPPIRDMASQWQCAPGTVQRAYHVLTEEGLLSASPGRGTVIRGETKDVESNVLRRATLINETDTFLIKMMAAGYTPAECAQAIALSLDRWKVLQQLTDERTLDQLRFVGSHDPAISRLAAYFHENFSNYHLSVQFSGSLGGLIALAEHRADIAGCHLWDVDSQTYNVPFVRRLLPGQRIAMLTLAQRRLGLLVAPGNPLSIYSLSDLARAGVRFINRQKGAGTRVWLDAKLHDEDISTDDIAGYEMNVSTHTQVAQAIAVGEADAGIGIQSAATSFGLEFVHLVDERYELVMSEAVWKTEAAQHLYSVLQSNDLHHILRTEALHSVDETGHLRWIE